MRLSCVAHPGTRCASAARGMRRRLAAIGAAAFGIAAIAAGCTTARSSTAPTDTVSPRPTATCPAPIVVDSPSAQPVRVTFGDPSAAGAIAPLSIRCSPESGTTFAPGTTTVACTVSDARQQTFTCSFTVRVIGPPRLSTTTILAFGDSLTSGTSPPDPPDSYPSRLQSKIAARYTTQKITVINDGRPGENAQATGRTRLPTALDLYKPGAALLMEGSNDLLGGAAA